MLHVLAFALIASPWLPPLYREHDDCMPATLLFTPSAEFLLHCQNVAIELELIDPTEVNTYFARPAEFRSDLGYIRQAYVECLDAPPVSVLAFLPDQETALEQIERCRKYADYLTVIQPLLLHHGAEIRALLLATEKEYPHWCDLSRAHSKWSTLAYKREALKRFLSTPAIAAPAPIPNM